MKLSEIIKCMKIEKISNFKDFNIECLTHKSSDVIEGSIFFCIQGEIDDGNNFVDEAVIRGAKAIVSEQDIQVKENVVNMKVEDVRVAMSVMAKNFYGKSDEKLKLVAIVGTNGKTTSTFVLGEILKTSGYKVGIIGTNGVYIDGEYLPSSLTTPDPIELHYIFNQMVLFGIDTVIMEVSAHAIYYKKVYGIKFDVGIFTNISNEHLDFFKDIENYANVKMSLFSRDFMKEAVVNIDDEFGVKIAKDSNIPVVSYGIYNPSNIFAVNIKMSIKGMHFFVNINDEICEIRTSLVGEYNIYNILGCIGVAKILGVSGKEIEQALKWLKTVSGRFNQYDMPNNKKIIIDFAHTPDGFLKIMSLVKKLRRGKLTCIFGCVGYSDTEKRALMGQIVDKFCEKIVITTDNIGFADFDEVAKDICRDIQDMHKVIKIEDRQQAIKESIKQMKKNETLLILGKGCETKQVIKGQNISYSDIEVVEKLLLGEKCD